MTNRLWHPSQQSNNPLNDYEEYKTIGNDDYDSQVIYKSKFSKPIKLKVDFQALQMMAFYEVKERPNQARFCCPICHTPYPMSYGTYSRKIRNVFREYEVHCKNCVHNHKLEKRVE